MLTKTVHIGDRDVTFKSSAAIPRVYRAKFKRDIFQDIDRLQKNFKPDEEKASTLTVEDLDIFESIAYVMNFLGEPGVPDSIDDWLDQFEMFSIYEILPVILEMWQGNVDTQVPPAKNTEAPQEN